MSRYWDKSEQRYAELESRLRKVEEALRWANLLSGTTPAPSEDRHWQNDADPNPGREQTAYQAEVEREKP